MNVRLFLAGALVLLAGIDSEYSRAWVVTAFGVAMIVASLLHPVRTADHTGAERADSASPAHGPKRERIVRERWRESRERYWPFDKAA